MTPPPRISVVVPSRDPRASLPLTLAGLRQQSHRNFDLVIVTNRPAQVRALPQAQGARIVTCTEANLSRARNLGVDAAAGEIIAFCDDDAVPEPTWLAELTAPFTDPRIGASGGLVRGKNGVSVQWGRIEVDLDGRDHRMPLPQRTITLAPGAGRLLKTTGTACAFRRDALRQIGGFDAAYRYFYDETDANLRLMRAGWHLAFVPSAQIHHGTGPSALRSGRGIPRDLTEIGASKALYLRRTHRLCTANRDAFFTEQRTRLLRLMQLGLLPPTRIAPLMASLAQGFATGLNRPFAPHKTGPAAPGTAFVTGPAPSPLLLTTGLRQRRAAHAEARHATRAGHLVTLIEALPAFRATTVAYLAPGYWRHRGGIHGRTERTEWPITLRTKHAWVARERKRLEFPRGIRATAG